MPRIKIELPDKFSFATDIVVRISDINYGGHLGNDAVLSILHEARVLYLKSLGFSELDAGGVSLIMGDAAIVFKSEGFHGDVLTAEVAAGDFSNSGFELCYRLKNKVSGKDVAHAKTGMVCFDYKERKIRPVPETLKKRMC